MQSTMIRILYMKVFAHNNALLCTKCESSVTSEIIEHFPFLFVCAGELSYSLREHLSLLFLLYIVGHLEKQSSIRNTCPKLQNQVVVGSMRPHKRSMRLHRREHQPVARIELLLTQMLMTHTTYAQRRHRNWCLLNSSSTRQALLWSSSNCKDEPLTRWLPHCATMDARSSIRVAVSSTYCNY